VVGQALQIQNLCPDLRKRIKKSRFPRRSPAGNDAVLELLRQGVDALDDIAAIVLIAAD